MPGWGVIPSIRVRNMAEALACASVRECPLSTTQANAPIVVQA